MVSPYMVAGPFGSYGLPEIDKPSIPEVFHIDDLLDFSCDDIGGPILGGHLPLSGVTTESSMIGGETSISSSPIEAKNETLEPALEDIEVKTDLCVPVSVNFPCSCTYLNASRCVIIMQLTLKEFFGSPRVRISLFGMADVTLSVNVHGAALNTWQ